MKEQSQKALKPIKFIALKTKAEKTPQKYSRSGR